MITDNSPSSKPIIYLLYKVSKREYLESIADGFLYCRTLSYYANDENKERVFYDAREGSSCILQPEENKLFLGGTEVTGICGPIFINYDRDLE